MLLFLFFLLLGVSVKKWGKNNNKTMIIIIIRILLKRTVLNALMINELLES